MSQGQFGMTAAVPPSKLALSTVFAETYLAHYRLLPMEVVDGMLLVAVEGRLDDDVADHLRHLYQMPLRLMPCDGAGLNAAIRASVTDTASVGGLVASLGGGDDRHDAFAGIADARDMANQPPVIRYVNLLITEAFERRASDVHLESSARGMDVRIRVDGVLSPLPAPPHPLQDAIVSRIKLLAELDIAQRRKPQDGRMRLRLEQRELDIRVATVPTMFGESLVLRLLDVGETPGTLEDLGMGADPRQRLEENLKRQGGLVLATGPTGSGKTTTLHCALRMRASGREKVVTVEDPIEYFVDGVTQVPVLGETGVSFASALRSILRQDPDVVMVGEMRDAETAAVAIQAALTGHLVLSTLHTTDTIAAIARLRDLDVASYLIGATLGCVVAQRLVRRLCPSCKAPASRPATIHLAPGGPAIRLLEHYVSRGCPDCRHSGYSGRLGLYELLQVTDALRMLIIRDASTSDLTEQASDDGMVPLCDDGLFKVRAGDTSVTELVRVLGMETT